MGAPAAVLDAARASLDACGRGETTLGYTVADGTDALAGFLLKRVFRSTMVLAEGTLS